MDKSEQEKAQQFIEDLRANLENSKKDYDAAQDENYKLVKKLNALKDESDNKDTQIRRLNTKITELKEEVSKVKASGKKEKELLYHRKSELLKLIKLITSMLKSMSSIAADYFSGTEAALDWKKTNMHEFLNNYLQTSVSNSKIQESIDAIISMAKQYKESEPMGDVCRPFDITDPVNIAIQKKFDLVLEKLTTTSSLSTPRPSITSPSKALNVQSQPQSKLTTTHKTATDKFEKAGKVIPVLPTNIKDEDDDKISRASSLIKSFNLEAPETSSIEFEKEPKTELLSTAKLLLALKFERNPSSEKAMLAKCVNKIN